MPGKLLLFFLVFATHSVVAQTGDHRVQPADAVNWLRENAETLGLDSSDLREIRVTDHYSDRLGGITHTYLQQYFDGIPVMNAFAGIHTDRNGRVVFHTLQLVSGLKIKSTPNYRADFSNGLKKLESQYPAIAGKNWQLIDPSDKTLRYNETDYDHYPCWYAVENDLIPCENYIFYLKASSDWLNVLINRDGNVVETFSWTVNCTTRAAKTFAAKSWDSSLYNVFSFSTESPLYGSRSSIGQPSDSLASPFGWHDINGQKGPDYTVTRGNNAYAYEDHDADNQPGYSPDGGNNLNFDFFFDDAEIDPLKYQDFAITNLFVANNQIHDILYHYGFDEPAGNFQYNNYNRGGTGMDFVFADAQDGSGTNNANFATPPEGSNPRMQMYIWDASAEAGAILAVESPSKSLFHVGTAQFGTSLTKQPITGKLVYVNDGAGNGRKGCDALKNSSALNGNIAVVERGNCLFTDKVFNAQQAGAIAVIVLDTSINDITISMGGYDPGVSIPSVFMKVSDADVLQGLMSGGIVNVSLYDSSGAVPKTDSDLDLGVIAHEYGHGLSNRLTCGPSNTNALGNAEQMGEGWSDFLALALTVKNGDLGSTPRGMANWLIGEKQTGGGIRTYPYSTNMKVNPHTYSDIKARANGTRTEVHYLGEVWCSMLWDLHWNMVDKYGFSKDLYAGNKGNNMAIQLVIEGLKLQKCYPGFVDGRNAILMADSLLYGGSNSQLIWETFARRGLGYSANQGSSLSTSDGIEAFDLPTANQNTTENIVENWVKLRPNPASGIVYIEPAAVSQFDGFQMTDLSGRFISVPFTNYPTGACCLDVSSLSPGMYFISVYAGSKKQVLKIQIR